MFDDIPELYRESTADTPEEGWRYVRGDPDARRPPELLTRDHVARCILREVRDGRGSPHGGVFLDIAWIAEKVSDGPAHIRRKLPGMYHQFKELAGIDITSEPMEVGPTTHYAMGGIRVDAETQMSSVPGLFAAGECAAGLHGANRLGGNSLSDLLVFGRRAGLHAAEFAKARGEGVVDRDEVEQGMRAALAPLERSAGPDVRGPYRVMQDVQELMQEKAGIIRNDAVLGEALAGLERLRAEADRTAVGGNREFNPGWHTAIDLDNILTVADLLVRAARERKESRGAHSRIDHPSKDDAWGEVNLVIRKGSGGEPEIRREPIPPMRQDLADIIEEQG
jgi:succinate dehydrogenase / fumarate reductase flavoprotein subunit